MLIISMDKLMLISEYNPSFSELVRDEKKKNAMVKKTCVYN